VFGEINGLIDERRLRAASCPMSCKIVRSVRSHDRLRDALNPDKGCLPHRALAARDGLSA
jgi:hypothetical protein